MGIMVENLEPVKYGHTGQLGAYWSPSENCSIIEGDTPPTSFGHASLVMDGTEKPATFRLSTHKQAYANLNGIWKYRLWAKVKEGNPQIFIYSGKYGEVQEAKISNSAEISNGAEQDKNELFPEEGSPFKLIDETPFIEEIDGAPLELIGDEFNQSLEIMEDEWTKYELTFQIDDIAELDNNGRTSSLVFHLSVTGGILMVDDLEIEKEGEQNPTAFRDEIVAALKRYNPGVIRKLQVGGKTVKSTIMPRLKSHRGTNSFYSQVTTNVNRSLSPYGLHEFHELAEYIGSEAWF